MRKFAQSGKEPFNLFKELDPSRSQSKGATMKQFYSKSFFQLGQLTTNRRLLDTVRHLTRGSRYASVLGDVIEQFEMMDVNPQIIIQIDDLATYYRLTQSHGSA